jgi:hypothetical protein
LANQQLDTLRLIRALREEPRAKASAMAQEHELAAHDATVRDFLETFYLEADRERSFDRFLRSPLPGDAIAAIQHFFGDRRDIAICEIGGGNGFLTAALYREGYVDIDVVEPDASQVTGTGYLRSLSEFSPIGVFNDLEAWYNAPKRYDLILSNACIHHFDNPAVVATQVRMKANENARWLALTEYFAVDFEDALSQLYNHRHAMLYGLYEWAYSARLYSEMLRSAGFALTEIAPLVPYHRRGPWAFFWSAACDLGLSPWMYGSALMLARRFRRGAVRRLDASYMAFEAKPIRWDRVERGYADDQPTRRPTKVATK